MRKLCRLSTYQVMAGVAAVVLISGCASVPAPIEQMDIAKAALSNANRASGDEFAPQQFELAKTKMEAAKRAMQEKNYRYARQLAEQVQVDAELAAIMARSAKAQRTAGALQENNRELQQEIEHDAQ
ncbi:DUF4398 domain-containing protein [Candidatus Methylobacter oryzae]|uniref:DUF4398 domain-containing protein n=1 Tax=Candidatus Methylobacter oryzae TaxID=2497749 RepID=A0ABY3CFK4_9GAMM|nr:DUF4398 domain-containing protein [Candidatus Methylobacter oryzae]TRX00918.1 DUF4398 domain-containing protein [Candidatus Methylobacter oryzae]